MTLDNCPALQTVSELATVLRVGRNTAYRLIDAGTIPAIKIGRQIRVYREDVIRFVSRSGLADMAEA